MITALELVNDNSISAIALTFFTALVTGMVAAVTGIYKIRADSKVAMVEATEARKEAEQAKKNTVNISNGFASGVGSKLDRILTEQAQQRKVLDSVSESLQDHLEWHLNKETP
jgi:hypothetical protein